MVRILEGLLHVLEKMSPMCALWPLMYIIWSSASFVNSFTLAGASEDVTDANGFTFQTISLIDGILTSSVSVFSSSGLNGALIECEDGLGSAEEQTTTAMVYGKYTT